MFEDMLKDRLDLSASDDLKFDFRLKQTPMQVKTTGGNSLRLGRYQNGLEIGQDFYLVYAKHKNHKILDVRSYLIDGLEYNKQFSFMILHYFQEHIKPLPDRSGKYNEYCADLKYMAKDKLIMPEVKKGGGNNRLQSYVQIKDLPQIGVEVDLGLSTLLSKNFSTS